MTRRGALRILTIAIALSISIWPLPAPSASSPDFARPLAPLAVEGARYRIDSSQSRFTVKAFAGGLLSGFAHDHTIAIREFTGETTFTYVTVAPASLQLTIKSDSLAVTDKISDSDREKITSTMRKEVLEVDKYPEIVFKSTNVAATRTGEGHYDAVISGDLTLHGVTRNVSMPARLVFNADNLRARGDFSVRQTHYNIKPVSIAAGTIKVKDELKFSFDIVARQ
jgi:polyisoprenoid-binding protein YceI